MGLAVDIGKESRASKRRLTPSANTWLVILLLRGQAQELTQEQTETQGAFENEQLKICGRHC